MATPGWRKLFLGQVSTENAIFSSSFDGKRNRSLIELIKDRVSVDLSVGKKIFLVKIFCWQKMR